MASLDPLMQGLAVPSWVLVLLGNAEGGEGTTK